MNPEAGTTKSTKIAYAIIVVLVIVAVPSFWHFWRLAQDPQKSQTASQTAGVLFVFLGFLLTAVWVWITAQYVHTNDQTLNLMKLQWDYQNRVDVHWGLRTRDNKAWLWVTNFGTLPIMISEVMMEQALDVSKRLVRRKHFIVQHAQTRGFYLQERVWQGKQLFCDIQVTLTYLPANSEPQSESKLFSMFLRLDSDNVYRISKGLHESWSVRCPKCNEWGLMQTDGLSTLAEANERATTMKSELSATCPDHQSPWSETVEHVRESNARDAQQPKEID